MTADEVRAYLEAQGWELRSENDRCISMRNGQWIAYSYKSDDELYVTDGPHGANVKTIATEFNLSALLRCLGAPVKDEVVGYVDGPVNIKVYKADGKWHDLTDDPDIKGVSIRGVPYAGPERRVADKPEAIPCKGCGDAAREVNDEDQGYSVWCWHCACVVDWYDSEEEALQAWKKVMGRRVTDWRKG